MIRVFFICFDELGLFLVFLAAVGNNMGCGQSKVDDLPLVALCRERKELIRAAADHTYNLSSAHVLYFASLKDVGDALRRFVDEEIVISSPADSGSPVLTLPSDEGKTRKKRNLNGESNKMSLSSTPSMLSRSDDGGGVEDSHLRLSSESDSELDSSSGHIRIRESPVFEPGNGMNQPLPQSNWGPYGMNPPPESNWGSYGVNPPYQTGYGVNPSPPYYQTGYGYGVNPNTPYQTDWEPNGSNLNSNSNTYAYYMKRSAPAVRTVIHGEEPRRSQAQSYGYSNSYSGYANENGGFFGFPMSSPPVVEKREPSPPAVTPAPPSPKVSAWDFLNPFDAYDNGYFSQGIPVYGSIASSPDSNEVREREGIPDLEEETENEVLREVHRGKKLNGDKKRNSPLGSSRVVPPQNSENSSRAKPARSREGSSRFVPSHSTEGSARAMPLENSEDSSREGPSQNREENLPVDIKHEKSSPDTIVSISSEEGHVKKKGVSFEVEDVSIHDVDSSKLSSLSSLSPHGTRDLQDVVSEIRDEFVIASSYGKEVAVMLEVGKLPYQPRVTIKVLLSRILYLIAPSLSSSRPRSRPVRMPSRTVKLARSYYGDTAKGINVKPLNLSSTLEKLYAWEKKLYKEVKDEERLRVVYEKMCKRLKVLDDRGAETSKIDAAQASIRRLLTKLNVCIRVIDSISSRIHKLRDEELQPQVNELINGLIRMWKSMLRCHQKQFQAIMDSKTRTLRANTGFQRDSSLRASLQLEMELLTWCSHFNDWVNAQKSYVESLNGWLLNCLNHEQEETADGIAPFSPSRIGAPPIFIICNDWSHAIETISESGVTNAVTSFASNLRNLWEKQDEEQNQRLKADYLSKDFEKRIRKLRMESGKTKTGRDLDAMSDKTAGSIVPSESGVSRLDDLKVDLDSIRKKLDEERARHRDAIKLVHDAASSSLQGGLVPIFKSLENFTSEALKAYEQVRVQNAGQGS